MDAFVTPKICNLNELVSYLTGLETCLAALESENKKLKNAIARIGQQTSVPTFKTPEDRLPNTRLISDSFLVRSFTVWGHYFVAQLIIGVPIFLCYLIFILSTLNSFVNP
jgi:hypothetical protein